MNVPDIAAPFIYVTDVKHYIYYPKLMYARFLAHTNHFVL
jgi:hypothetical protein